MKKILIVVGILGIGAAPLVFKLFEPVFTHESGWNALPAAMPLTEQIGNTSRTNSAVTARAVLVDAQQKLDVPAMAVAVTVDGKIVWRAVTGFADVERRIPAGHNTMFRIGSTSKAVTAIAVGTLIDQSKLDLGRSIQTYVKSFPEKRWPVNLGQVMSHRAGIRDYGLCLCFPVWEHLNRRKFASIDEAIALVADEPLAFQPGSDFRYTSLGYNLTGAAIEGASGQTFDR